MKLGNMKLGNMRLGILSDTHGLLREEVLGLLVGSDLILHAGDVGDERILQRLRELAPVLAVRGNTDTDPPLTALPFSVVEDLAGQRVCMVHRREDVLPAWAHEASLIVFGHSHRPELEWRGRALLLNPGACGAPRFRLPLTVARVELTADGRLEPEILRVPRG